jgi:hypothetical protein
MENVLYNVIDKNKSDFFFDLNTLYKQIDYYYFEITNKQKIKKLEEIYTKSFTLNQIKIICGYYNINFTKQTKDELIKKIVLFEIDEKNEEYVETRKRLLNNLIELKNNSYFSKYILLNW